MLYTGGGEMTGSDKWWQNVRGEEAKWHEFWSVILQKHLQKQVKQRV